MGAGRKYNVRRMNSEYRKGQDQDDLGPFDRLFGEGFKPILKVGGYDQAWQTAKTRGYNPGWVLQRIAFALNAYNQTKNCGEKHPAAVRKAGPSRRF